MDFESSLFYVLIPFVAFLYSSVGHGGASGYLALMAVFSFPSETMKYTALLLNLFVAGIAFYHYYKAGYFNKKLFLYFALGSVPAAFIGGLWSLDPWLYKKILGGILFFAIVRMLFNKQKSSHQIKEIPLLVALSVGASIGLISGLIGIGGGIILTPLILLFHWGNIDLAGFKSLLALQSKLLMRRVLPFNMGADQLMANAAPGGPLGLSKLRKLAFSCQKEIRDTLIGIASLPEDKVRECPSDCMAIVVPAEA